MAAQEYYNMSLAESQPSQVCNCLESTLVPIFVQCLCFSRRPRDITQGLVSSKMDLNLPFKSLEVKVLGPKSLVSSLALRKASNSLSSNHPWSNPDSSSLQAVLLKPTPPHKQPYFN